MKFENPQNWKLVKIGDGWRHINHVEQLLTLGWAKRSKAIQNKDGYLMTDKAKEIMHARYLEFTKLCEHESNLTVDGHGAYCKHCGETLG